MGRGGEVTGAGGEEGGLRSQAVPPSDPVRPQWPGGGSFFLADAVVDRVRLGTGAGDCLLFPIVVWEWGRVQYDSSANQGEDEDRKLMNRRVWRK